MVWYTPKSERLLESLLMESTCRRRKALMWFSTKSRDASMIYPTRLLYACCSVSTAVRARFPAIPFSSLERKLFGRQKWLFDTKRLARSTSWVSSCLEIRLCVTEKRDFVGCSVFLFFCRICVSPRAHDAHFDSCGRGSEQRGVDVALLLRRCKTEELSRYIWHSSLPSWASRTRPVSGDVLLSE